MMTAGSKPLYEVVNKEVFDRIHTQVGSQVRRSLLKGVYDHVHKQVYDQVFDQVDIQLGMEILAKVGHGNTPTNAFLLSARET